MISWNQWLRLFSQPILHVFNHKKLYTNKKKRPSLEGLEERITPVNPSVISILRNAGTAASTSASYAVSFSESVTGVDSADFTTSTSGGVASTSISVAGSGSTYTVTISGITGTGSIRLNLIDDDTIKNLASQPLGGTNLSGISFSSKTDYSTGTSSGPHAIIIGLINADGFTDIITANRSNDTGSVLLGVGDGTFNTQTSFTTGAIPLSIASADINSDGKLDLVAANSYDDTGGNTISALLGNGDGKFKTQTTFATQSRGPYAVVLGDFNNDLKLDIATANYGSNSVSILLGNGDGKFTAATTFATLLVPKSIATGDVNGDGFLDLATADLFGGLSLLLGNGNGSFKAAASLTAGKMPSSVIMADVNGDGKIDIISANYNSENVIILLGNGNGTFQSATSVSTGRRPVSVAAADLDGDGKIDLAVANSYNNIVSPINTVGLLAGNGDGTFKTAINFTTGTTPYSVTIADFNGDSKPDIATANEGSDNISVFLNTTNNPSNFTGETYTVDAIPPTISIASDKTSLSIGQTANLTFTLSEATTDFIEADVSITGGVLSNFAGSGLIYTATFTPNTNSTATATFNVAAATFTDAAGNNNTAASQFTINVDTTAPTIIISSSTSALKSGETASITFTFSEAASDFIASDITVAGGTLGTLSGSGTSYTATFTPTANSTTAATINVLANTFTDAAGNDNTAATQLSVSVDTVSPTVGITSDRSTLRSGQTATITFTLSEAASDFAVSDIVASGGALSALTIVSATSYTAVFTPTTNSTTAATFNVLANTFTDTAGNNNTAASQLSIIVDTVAPSITITSDKTSLKSGETANITFTLSESTTDFIEADVSITGGALSNFSGSGLTYTATFTPNTNSTTPASINIIAGTFTDSAGNNNIASNTISITVDTTAPNITITSDRSTLRSGQNANITFTLSEAASTALISSNITVLGGVLSNFAGSGTSYSAVFTPTGNSTTPASINIIAGTFTDSAGNNNIASNTISITVDTTAPAITITSDKTTLKSGQTATITFTLSEVASDFIATDITVVGGLLSSFTGTGTSYTATFTPTNNTTATATFNVLANTFTDAAGNANTAATQISATVDTVAPTITITSSASALNSGQTATLTFTLSEAASDFTQSDITVASGILGTLSGAGNSYTATFTPTNNSTTPATFNVAAATFTDAAGNNNTAASQFTINVDTTAPTIIISSSTSALKSGETATLIFTLSEATSDFIASDIVTTGGTLGTLSGTGSSYTATFTPTTNSTTTATFNVAAGTFTDSAGNANTAATQLSMSVDTTAPTITISSNKTALQIGETANITFTLSEASSDFIGSDITVAGGTLGTLSGAGNSYTAVFTPTANTTATATINVATSAFTDAAGNPNIASNTISITVDTTAPTITIASDKTALKLGETANITFTLSEAASDFIASDIVTTGGTLGTLSGAGNSYTATFTPTNNSTTPAIFNVIAATFTDTAGNNNTAAAQLSINIDTVAPTITITSSASALKSGQTATLTFTLSEASSNFIEADISITGGALSNFAVVSGTSYTATFIPTANSTTPAAINVAAGTFTDAAGNNNTAASQFTINVDTTAPTIIISSSTSALKSGETATITFTLSEAASDFIQSDITVAGGTLGTLSGSGSSYTAVFTPTANSTTTATFNVAAATFTDAAGNNNTAATQLSVAVDTISPAVTITSSASALKSGEIATITFTLSEAASDFAFGDIVVAGGALSALTIVSTTSYTAVFTPTTNSITTATFNVAAATFTDAVGNNNTAASQFTINVDTTAPTITISSNKTALRIGETATLTFTLSEAASDFAVSDIVATGGALSTLTIVSTTSYTATFIPTANSTTPAAINVAAAIFTDTAGNNNTAATQLSITVDTTAPTITISSNKTSLNLGETATLTFMLSEATSTALISSNITVVGGVLSNFAGAGTSYTATFTPTANSTTIATFNVLVNTFTDSPGNNNLASNTISLTVDTTAPAITIASDKTSLVTAQTATLTFTLSEPSANFSDTDIVSAGGTLSTLVGSGTSYTATFTPNTNSTTTATFNVAAAAFTDSASNANTAASQLSINIDTVALPPSPTPSPAPNPAPSPAPPRKMTASSSSLMTGVTSTVNLIDQDTGKQINSVIPFPGFSGELRIAMADVNHDGKMETIIAAGPGGGPAIMVMESETGTVLQTFFAFEPAFTGGIFVAIADFNTDGIMDIVVGAGSGGGPHIKIFDGLTQNVLRSFFAYQENFSGGVSVAATDINGDGFAELVTGAGTGGSSHVKVFNGKTFEIISQWYAYSSDFKGGVFVAVGDIGNNGKCEIVTGAGEGGGPVVAIWDPYTGALLNQFLAYDENFRGGARVGISDKNGDGIANLLTGAGPGGGPQVNGYSFPTLDLLFSFYSGNINNAGGVFVS